MESDIFSMGVDLTEMLAVVLVALACTMLVILAYSAVAYVLQSISLHTVARRRGIKHSWLAWVPFGSDWILGSISDQFRYVRCGEIRNRRVLLLVLNGLVTAISLAESVTYLSIATELVGGASVQAEDILLAMIETSELMNDTFWYSPVISTATLAVEIAATVCFYRCLWDYYGSTRPKTRLVFLLLSIFVGMPMPFFMFVCRKDDLGMPPKKVVDESALPPAPAALPACEETE